MRTAVAGIRLPAVDARHPPVTEGCLRQRPPARLYGCRPSGQLRRTGGTNDMAQIASTPEQSHPRHLSCEVISSALCVRWRFARALAAKETA